MKYLLYVVFAFSSAVAVAQSSKVKVSGTLKNFNNQVELAYHSEFKDLTLPGSSPIIIPDSNGRFSISFPLDKPQYFRLGRNMLYLSPGDEVILSVDYKDPNKGTFEGSAVAVNEYLRGTPFPKGGSFLEAGSKIKGDLSNTIAVIEAAGAARSRQLMAPGIPAGFRALEEARIKADIINSLYMLEFYYPYAKKIKAKDSLEMFSADMEKIVMPVIAKYTADFGDASFLQLETYRDIADNLVKDETIKNSKDYKKIQAWLIARDIADSLKHADSKAAIIAYAPRIAAITDPAYRASVKKVYDQLIRFGDGDNAVNFTACDVNGKPVSLKSFEGKLIYIDLWATWCGPCQDELKHFAVLKAQFKDNSNIVFVSLSIDDDKELWKKSLKARNADGVQLIINREKLNDYAVSTIPRTILIGKNFKVIQMNSLQPSNKNISVFLNEQLSGR